jgi:hypothetical protein
VRRTSLGSGDGGSYKFLIQDPADLNARGNQLHLEEI